MAKETSCCGRIPTAIHCSLEEDKETVTPFGEFEESPSCNMAATPLKTRPPGILKPSSYSNSKPRKTKAAKTNHHRIEASTPSTVASSPCSSPENSPAVSKSSSFRFRIPKRRSGASKKNSNKDKSETESHGSSLDRIIDCISRTTNNSPQRRSRTESPLLLEEFPITTTESGSNEDESEDAGSDWQRTARIQHIRDLNERIRAAKARKALEKKAYRREDRLLLRLARELKRTTKFVEDNQDQLQQMEDANEDLKDRWARSRQELQDLRAARLVLQDNLARDRQSRLQDYRRANNDFLEEQSRRLESLKSDHQSQCQALCESVLRANSELDRLLRVYPKDSKERRAHWLKTLTAVVAVGVFVVLAGAFAVQGARGHHSTTTAAGLFPVPNLLDELNDMASSIQSERKELVFHGTASSSLPTNRSNNNIIDNDDDDDFSVTILEHHPADAVGSKQRLFRRLVRDVRQNAKGFVASVVRNTAANK